MTSFPCYIKNCPKSGLFLFTAWAGCIWEHPLVCCFQHAILEVNKYEQNQTSHYIIAKIFSHASVLSDILWVEVDDYSSLASSVERKEVKHINSSVE